MVKQEAKRAGFLRQTLIVMSSVKIIQRTDRKGKTDIAPLYIQVIIDRPPLGIQRHRESKISIPEPVLYS